MPARQVPMRLLQGAIGELKDIKSSDKNWPATKKAIQAELSAIRKNPLARATPTELQDMATTQYRQGLTTYHRIIYEVTDDAIYVHIICHQRKDLTQILLKRVSSNN